MMTTLEAFEKALIPAENGGARELTCIYFHGQAGGLEWTLHPRLFVSPSNH